MRCRFPRGFTLIELLIVLTILITLIALLLPMMTRAGELSRSVRCASNLHQQHLAALTYAQDNRRWLPPSRFPDGNRIPQNHYSRWFLTNWGPADGKVWNFAHAWQGGYAIGDGRIFYCPSQGWNDRSEIFTYKFYDKPFYPAGVSPDSTPYSWSTGIRVSYNWNPVTVSTKDRTRRFERSNELSGHMLMACDLVSDGDFAVAHIDEPSWNTLTGDGSVGEVRDPTILADMQSIGVTTWRKYAYAEYDSALDRLRTGRNR